MIRSFSFILALAVSPLANAQDAPSSSENDVKISIYNNVSIIDGTGSPAQPDRTLVIEDGKIAAIIASDGFDATVYPGADIVDAGGQTVIPGLIDTHVHLRPVLSGDAGDKIIQRFLYSGITSVRDMAGDARVLANQSRAFDLNIAPGPNVYYSALMAGPSFFTDPRPAMSAQGKTAGDVPWMKAITADTDMTIAVAQAKGTSATGIKIYANLSAPEVHRIAAEGRKQGMKVWAHSMVFPARPSEVVSAGVDSISHVCRLAFESTHHTPQVYDHGVKLDYNRLDPRHPKIRTIYSDMKARGTILDATVWLYSVLEERQAKIPDAERKRAICPSEYAVALTRLAHEMGVDISTGTDASAPLEDAYPALHKEIETLVHKVGMTPLEAIRSATLIGAKTIGEENERGTIAVGKSADLVFLNADPADDIANLRTVRRTLKKGFVFLRSDYEDAKNAPTQ
ncbi:amidohydrolase family protein [Algimonas porphyrae]|uniref:Xaa-Pro dipeptidase n=1 Tax=Algimonas porphyrae TaxID=1128113 RepID=A0ABQ5V299_9PROT|nr:amidohydrolase family protein [Algimonas porphyrae]GLQ21678.1 Xaa-Pro dipeptidase [Algimonas porphyrae]